MPTGSRIWTRPTPLSPHGPRRSARWKCSWSPSGTGSLARRYAMSARSCMTRTCMSVACSNGSTTTRSATSSSRHRHCVFTELTGWRSHRVLSSVNTTEKSMAAGSDCRRARSPILDRTALFSASSGENLAEPLDRAEYTLLRKPRPLTAHDEMVDTEKLAVPCDLLLYRHFVADDETVARKILERALRATV